jgi:hypothetical protein
MHDRNNAVVSISLGLVDALQIFGTYLGGWLVEDKCAGPQAQDAVVPLVTLYRCGQREKPERVRRCLEALAQSGQELPDSPLVRHLTHYAEHLERGTDWANGNEQSA